MRARCSHEGKILQTRAPFSLEHSASLTDSPALDFEAPQVTLRLSGQGLAARGASCAHRGSWDLVWEVPLLRLSS